MCVGRNVRSGKLSSLHMRSGATIDFVGWEVVMWLASDERGRPQLSSDFTIIHTF